MAGIPFRFVSCSRDNAQRQSSLREWHESAASVIQRALAWSATWLASLLCAGIATGVAGLSKIKRGNSG